MTTVERDDRPASVETLRRWVPRRISCPKLETEIEILSIRDAIEIGFVRFAAIFGSYLNGSSDYFRDIDLLVVCEEDNGRKAIRSDMLELSYRMGRVIHLNDYNIDEFERCLRYRDYKLASILDDALFLVGDIDYTKRLNCLERVDDRSIAYNETMGAKILNRALENLKNFQHSVALSPHPPEFSWRDRYFQNLCIRDSHLALGYLLASQRMKQTGAMTMLRELLSEGMPLMRTLILVDKWTKRMGKVSLRDTEEYVLKVKSEYTKIMI